MINISNKSKIVKLVLFVKNNHSKSFGQLSVLHYVDYICKEILNSHAMTSLEKSQYFFRINQIAFLSTQREQRILLYKISKELIDKNFI